jgi:putative peptide zinc metalloprotease protein
VSRPIRDNATRDLLQTPLRLRGSVVFRPSAMSGEIWYQVECQERGRFFRIGHAEYVFVSLLDGDTTPAEAISLTSRVLGPNAFSEEQAKSIIRWLLNNELTAIDDGEERIQNLLEPAKDDSEARPRVNDSATTRRASNCPSSWLSRLNPFWLKVPFGNPDRIVGRLTEWLGWMHSGPAIVAALILQAVSLLVLSGNWTAFRNSTPTILAPDNWLWLTGAWLGLKLIHETSHAIACRRHGGSVRETGLIFILLAPMAYVDVTSSLRFRSKWQRIQTAVAGMYVELTLAAVALIVWSQIDSPFLKHQLCNVVFMASISTLLFNANPLMRFDGYYVLSDLFEIPNLYSRGTESVQRLTRRVLFGQRGSALGDSPGRSRFILTYGLAALVWRAIVCLSLLLAASVMFHGLGVLLAGFGVMAWVGKPILLGVRSAATMLQTNPKRLLRGTVTGSLIAGALAAGLFLTPWPLGQSAPGIIEYEDFAVVRVDSSGFILGIHVRDGERVEAGQLLLQLQNEELESQLGDLEAAAKQSDLKYRGHLKRHEMADAQAERENRLALEKRLVEKRKHIESLEVRAPISGRVMSRSLSSLAGTFASEGAELLSVGDESRKEFHASLAQADVATLRTNELLAVRLPGAGLLNASVVQVTPRASHKPPHRALTAPAGGPLAVRAAGSSREGAEDEFEFPEPRVTVHLQLEASKAGRVAVGTTGRAIIESHEFSSLAAGLYTTARRDLQARLAMLKDEQRQ